MRRVRLLCAIKTDEPRVVGDAGDELRLPDYATTLHVRLGNMEYIDGGDDSGPPPPPRAELERQEAERLAALQEPKTEPSDPAEPPKRPYGNAPKSAWVAYACAVDEKMTEERAEGMTKADLMSRYGERL